MLTCENTIFGLLDSRGINSLAAMKINLNGYTMEVIVVKLYVIGEAFLLELKVWNLNFS